MTEGDVWSPSSPGSDLPDFIGRYRVGRVLGQGGFALVVKAWDEALDSAVAIKILDRRYASDDDVRRRFVNEARVLRRVDASNVVSVHDVGELDDGRPFFVMQFAEGGVLAERIPAGPGLVDGPSLRTVIESLAAGLGALHADGVIHRDVKPGNLLIAGGASGDGQSKTVHRGGLLGDGERVLVGDLGLAKIADETSAGPTMLGGTLHFRAPEQSKLGAEITPPTDVYAATGVVWNLLTGGVPPAPDDVERSLTGVDPAWRSFFQRGMAADPGQRFRSMQPWADAAGEAIDQATGPSGFTPVSAGAVCPYKGLASFQPEDADFFFGRERLVDELIARLQSSSTLVIGGPSGSGKSSLLRAGLVPAVARGALPGSQQWPIMLFTPGAHPLRELHHQMRTLPGFAERQIGLDDLRAEPSLVEAPSAATSGALLAIDQFEEVFTAKTDEAATFIAVLEHLTRPHHGGIRVALAVRADFYGTCALHPWLAEKISTSGCLVGPMSRAELHQAIEAPAQRAGLRLEPGLVDEVLDQAPSDAGALPLVAHALMETWIRRKDDELTINGLQAAGGVGGAIAQRADQIYDSLPPDQRAHMQTLFLDLVNPGEGTPDTRRRVTWDELGDDPALRGLINQLADARLLTVDDTTVEVAHEALIATWPRLREWIEEARDDLRLRDRIDRAAGAWIAGDRDPALLYRGTPLTTANEWRADGRPTARQAEFLDESERVRIEDEAAAAQAQRRSQRVRRIAVSALAVLTVLAVAASAAAFWGLARSQDNERAARDQFLTLLANQSVSLVDSDPLVAVMLAAEGAERLDPPTPSAQGLVVDARLALSGGGVFPAGAPVSVPTGKTIAMRPDGAVFAVGGRSGQLVVWSANGRRPVAELVGHDKGIESAAFSPDGTALATGDSGGNVFVWDLKALDAEAVGADPVGMVQSPLMSTGSTVWGLAFSPDGEQLATTTESGTVQLINPFADDPQAEIVVDDSMRDYLSVAYDPSGRLLAIGSGTGLVQIWDGDTDSVAPVGDGHTSDVWQLAFTADGGRLVSVSSNETKVWDVETGREERILFEAAVEAGALDRIEAATVLADGTVLGGGSDGRLWTTDVLDADPASPATTAVGHDAKIARAGVVRSGDGSVVASLSDDETVRLWSVVPRADAVPVVAEIGADGYGLAVSEDGRLLLVGDGDGTAHVVDTSTGTILATLGGHDGRVFGAGITDDGALTGDQAGQLRLWSVDGLLLAQADAHGAAITSIATHPDSEVIATSSDDGTVRFWSLPTLEPTTEALGSGGAAVSQVSFAPGGDYVAASYWSGEVKFWSTGGGSAGSSLVADANALLGVAISPDGEFLALGSADERTLVFDLGEARDGGDAEPLHRLTPESRGAVGVAFGADDLLVTSNRAGEVRLWNPRAGLPISPSFALYDDDPWRVVIEPGTSVAWVVGSGGDLRRIDLVDRETNCRLTDAAADRITLDRYLNGEDRVGCG